MAAPYSAEELFQQLKATPKKVNIDGTTYYVIEGDLFLDETELFAYTQQWVAWEQARSQGLQAQPERLLGITDDAGRIVRWRKGLILTYTVERNTFDSQQQYDMVVAGMLQATSAWEAICGVNFKHLQDLDNGPNPGITQPIFRVAYKDSQGSYIAIAFFPYHAPPRRVIYIDPTFFLPATGYNQVGVLRHELGHVLGFRHEQIRSEAPPFCPDEPLGMTINLTKYDPRSVMHYFCGGVGSRELAITEVDQEGARLVYGPPDREVTYYE
jgi:hypothetical protein